jgi:CDP-glucose 4,6-dehydratase
MMVDEMQLRSFYSGKRVLITGHTGFKGAWLSRLLLEWGAQVHGYSLEPPTQPNLFEIAGLDRAFPSVLGDVRDLDGLERTFRQARPEIVFHLAAQPIVREGYRDPVSTYEINVMGTVNLLECVRRTDTVRSVINVTTDKVYDNREWAWPYRESDRLDGYDPYSNSKSCSELVTHSYVRSFLGERGVAVSAMRAGNVIGGGDFAPDRIIPDCVRGALKGEPVLVRNPHSVRPYQHVLEPLSAYLLAAAEQYADPAAAGCYNVGPEEQDCVSTGTLAQLFCQTWGEGAGWHAPGGTGGPHEANFLRLDSSKIRARLGWRPRWHIEQAVGETVEWTRAWREKKDIQAEMSREIGRYFACED